MRRVLGAGAVHTWGAGGWCLGARMRATAVCPPRRAPDFIGRYTIQLYNLPGWDLGVRTPPGRLYIYTAMQYI